MNLPNFRLYSLLFLLLAVFKLSRGCPMSEEPSSCECQRFEQEKRIIGGSKARLHEYPFQALIIINFISGKTRKKEICGGTLISREWVLTSGHCVKSKKLPRAKPKFIIRLGEHNPKKRGETGLTQTLRAKEYILHENFKWSRSENDVALIKLDRPADLTEAVSPACLPKAFGDMELNGEEVTAMGWGRVSENRRKESSVLKKLDLYAYSAQNCIYPKSLWTADDVTDDVLCGRAKGSSVCDGDTGGPLIYEENGRSYVVGITSFPKREKCVEHLYPMLFTRVSAYINWIEEQTGKEFCSP